MIDSYAVILQHCAETLPADIGRRIALLTAIRSVLKKTHPAVQSIDHQINSLRNAERLQAELPLKFK